MAEREPYRTPERKPFLVRGRKPDIGPGRKLGGGMDPYSDRQRSVVQPPNPLAGYERTPGGSYERTPDGSDFHSLLGLDGATVNPDIDPDIEQQREPNPERDWVPARKRERGRGPGPPSRRLPVDPLAWWVIVGVVALGALLYWSATRENLSGTVAATGPTLGMWTMHVDRCEVSSIGLPHTLTLIDTSQPALRMTVKNEPQNPPGIQVVSTADGQVHAVEFDRCGEDRVETSVPPASKVLSGNLVLNCAVGQSRLTAQVSFENCR